jgi:hypothetical protein
VLPALLVALGSRIDSLSPAWLQRRAARSASVQEDGGWWRLARGVMRRRRRQSAVGAGADGADGRLELVGAGATAAVA